MGEAYTRVVNRTFQPGERVSVDAVGEYEVADEQGFEGCVRRAVMKIFRR